MKEDIREKDFDLIRRYQNCERKALELLIEKYYSYIYRSFIYKGIPPYSETKYHVKKVEAFYTKPYFVSAVYKAYNKRVNNQ